MQEGEEEGRGQHLHDEVGAHHAHAGDADAGFCGAVCCATAVGGCGTGGQGLAEGGSERGEGKEEGVGALEKTICGRVSRGQVQ